MSSLRQIGQGAADLPAQLRHRNEVKAFGLQRVDVTRQRPNDSQGAAMHQRDSFATAAAVARADQHVRVALPPVARVDGGVARRVAKILHRKNAFFGEEATGGSEASGPFPGDIEDGLLAAQDLSTQFFLAEIALASMAVGVVGNFVALGHDLASQGGELAHMDSYHKESRLDFVVLEDVQQQRRVERVGAVVKSHGDQLFPASVRVFVLEEIEERLRRPLQAVRSPAPQALIRRQPGEQLALIEITERDSQDQGAHQHQQRDN
ncbi:hypothetical protein ABS71_14225 [bacterium SCN 62-11]|nr:MAG: hypothetical protein ABS71_14225 [bacterium SCN 62-11]